MARTTLRRPILSRSVDPGRSGGKRGRAAAHEDRHSRRLSRHAAHAALLRQARRPRCHHLERSRPGRRCAGRAAARHRGAGADTRADADPRAAARAAAPSRAHQPAQRLSAHRHRRLHPARRDRVVEPAPRHALLCRGGADLGPGARGDAPDPAADGRAPGRQMADRNRQHPARQDARHLRLRPHRQRRRRLRPRLRHECAGLGARDLAGAGARRRLRDGGEQGRAVRGQRCPLAAHAPGRGDAASSPRTTWPA